jgi:3-keto-disaccharide hydrolase
MGLRTCADFDSMRKISLFRHFLLALNLSATLAFCAESINQLTEEDKAGGWKLLFDGKTTQGWHSFKAKTVRTNAWVVEDGWLHCPGKEGGGDIISDAEFDNFDLQWEWKQAPGGNSGLKYFVSEKRESPLGHEYQMIDDERNGDAKLAQGKRVTGSFYDVLKPERIDVAKPPGEINRSRVIVKGNHVQHWLNGAKVLDYTCDSEALKTALEQSKFKNTKGFGQKTKGHILLQDHHSEVWFRNIEIRELPAQ